MWEVAQAFNDELSNRLDEGWEPYAAVVHLGTVVHLLRRVKQRDDACSRCGMYTRLKQLRGGELVCSDEESCEWRRRRWAFDERQRKMREVVDVVDSL